MAKTATLVAALCVAALFMWSEQPNRRGNEKDGCSQQEPPTAITSINNYESGDASTNPHDSPPHWYTPLKKPEGWLVLVGIGTLITIAWQSIETRRAANAAGQNVTVAREQIEATIAEKRAWILIDSEEVGPRIQEPYLVPIGTVPDKELRMSHCVFFLKNFGHTPARLLSLKAVLQIGDSSSEPPPPNIFDVREIGRERVVPLLIPPGQRQAWQAELSPQGTVSVMELEAVKKANGKYLWLSGIVKYRQTLRPAHSPEDTMRFCYLWETRTNASKPFWRMAGKEQYNEAT